MGGGEGRSSRSSSSSDGGSSEHGAGKKKKQRRSWSRLEIALTVTASLFVVACAALIAVAWLAVEDSKQSGRTERTELSGNMKIVTGAEFTPALLDRESAEFKTLAFDFEKTINDVYSASAMKNDYISCKVLTFRSGSVSTSFGLEFFSGSSVQSVVDEALATLKEAIVPLGGGSTDGRLGRFTVDLASVGVSGVKPTEPGKPPGETSTPKTTTQPGKTTTTKQPPTGKPTTPKEPSTGKTTTTKEPPTDVCSLGQKQCHNSSTACVYEELFCDGNVDCSEGSDETPTDCAFCPLLFTCGDRSCVPSFRVCDGNDDCADGKDEQGCVHLALGESHSLQLSSGTVDVSVAASFHAACADNWNGHLSVAVCRQVSQGPPKYATSVLASDYAYTSFALVINAPDKPVDYLQSAIGAVTTKCPSERLIFVACEPNECGLQPALPPAGRIVNGEPAKAGSWPWMASLSVAQRHRCGASLINNEWLVTAAHCIVNTDPNSLQVVLGSLATVAGSIPAGAVVRSVRALLPHPCYGDATCSPTAVDYDVGLVRLASPLEGSVTASGLVGPACVPSGDLVFNDGELCFTSGWGKDGAGALPSVLQELRIPIMNQQLCNESIHVGKVSPRMICAAYKAGHAGVCSGDSGGPLVCQRFDGRWYLAGITSWGLVDSEGRCSINYDVFARVTSFSSWIESIQSQAACGAGELSCDAVTCVRRRAICDGVENCADKTDEANCASGCDDNFLFTETSGEFHSINYPQNYEDNTNCRWIIQVPQGHAIDFTFSAFSVEFNYDFLRIYSGLGEDMLLRASLTGTENPGLVRLFSNVATVEFSSDVSLNSSGFAARYSSFSFGDLSNKELIDCTFESGWCYWEQDPYDSADWERLRGPSSPQGSGPDVDHTVGDATGYYIRGSVNGVAASLVSQLLAPQISTACLQFWYHMHGVDVYRLTVFLRMEGAADSLLWQKEGNYGNQWHYGQIAINQTQSFKVVVEARRRLHQLFNEIALDDVALIPGVCPPPPPEPTHVIPTTPPCPPGQFVCADISCVPLSARCDGVNDCNDASDEASCTSGCDDNFLLTGMSGSFNSMNFPGDYDDNANCRWIIRAPDGYAVQISFSAFALELRYDFLKIYKGLGPSKELQASLTGTSIPGDVRVFSHELTVEFTSDPGVTDSGFSATFTAFDFSGLTNKELVDCSFESGWCYWDQDPDDSADWERLSGPSSPATTGPDVDHTFGNSSGFYIRNQNSGVATSIRTFTLDPEPNPTCLKFWYHMYGVDVYRLSLSLRTEGVADVPLWVKEGNYGNQWHYGQLNFSQSQNFQVVFEARRRPGSSEIALDDISLEPGACPELPYPEPTPIIPTTPPCPAGQFVCADISCIPLSARCDGVNDCNDASDEASCTSSCDDNFLLTGTSGSFNSMNFPENYGNNANCRWIIRAPDGYGVQISFSAFDLEHNYDFLKIYKGLGADKELQASLTGTSNPGDVRVFAHELTVEFTSDSSAVKSGFNASFSAFDFSALTNKDLVDCSFESGWCYWDQDPYDSANWERLSGPSSPATTGPDVDHTFGNSSGFYIRNQNSGVATSIRTFTLDPEPNPTCLKFWYYMYGVDVYRLSLSLRTEGVADVPLWQNEGNYGNQWHYGQLNFSQSQNFQVVFEARRRSGSSEIALDDISLEPGACPELPYPPPTPIIPTTPPCPAGQFVCADISCIPLSARCDGVNDCNDASDEASCTSGCDDNFLFTGTSGSFNSMNFPGNYDDNANCRWLIRAPEGYAVQFTFSAFALENQNDFFNIYKGIGAAKERLASLTGVSNPGDVRAFAHELTVEFTSNGRLTYGGFSVSFSAFDFSGLTNKELVDCTFESGWCYWDQDPYDSADWQRLSGPSSPATTGPDVDHTLGNSSGFYIRNQNSGVATSIRTFTLDPEPSPTCLKFWFHMNGVDVYRLSVSLRTEGVADVPLWVMEGNYGNQWHYGQLNFSQSQNFQVVFEARRRSGSSEIALDDISLEPGACPELPYPLPTPIIPTTPPCPAGQFVCADISCIPLSARCDGVNDCNDASDEISCTSGCDDNFQFTGTSGSFNSMNFPGNYEDNANCRWLIRAPEGYAVQFTFSAFELEDRYDFVNIYKGIGAAKERLASLTGRNNPGDVRAFANELTVEFTSDSSQVQGGFSVSFTAFDFSQLTNKELVDCSFESGWCYWDQDPYDSADWERLSGPSSPASTGPDVDHTFGNSSGFYIRNQNSGTATSIRTFTLDPEPISTCLKFWYYMYGRNVYRLSLSLRKEGAADVPLWSKEGNYGNQWHYGQLSFMEADNFQVVFEARRRASESEIALDDISLEPGACPELPYPEPTPFIITTPVPTTTPPPPPRDCDGPHELREPNVTFTSPRFPFAYMDNADCTWYLLADEGKNVLLHFSVFSLENNYDYVELRDGYGSDAPLIGRYTGSGPREDVFSTASAMTVRFTSDSSINSAGFNANFSTGVRLGMPPTCAPDQFQCQDLECVAREAVCDRNVDCSDGSDEKNCVRLQNRVGPSGVAQFLVDSQWHSVCSSAAWITQFNAFVCLYTGYPGANSSSSVGAAGYGPYVVVSGNSITNIQLTPSVSCPTNQVVQTNCNPPDCGKRPLVPSGRVVGGQDAVPGGWPWVVSLRYNGRHLCGASIVDDEWLVTAAHCVEGRDSNMDSWGALLGLHLQSDHAATPSQSVAISAIHIHPSYDDSPNDNDIALMRLAQPIEFTDYIAPVCLPEGDQDFPADMTCAVAGWGNTREGGGSPDALQEAEVPLLSNEACIALQGSLFDITDNMVCAGFVEGGVDTCQGDSGGPLMCEQSGTWFLVGITSFGQGCARPNRPGVYARVTQYPAWINGYLEQRGRE